MNTGPDSEKNTRHSFITHHTASLSCSPEPDVVMQIALNKMLCSDSADQTRYHRIVGEAA
jgi:hypothetical protein